MMTTVTATRYTCDGCGKVILVEDELDDFIGLKGSVFEATDTTGGNADWFACARKCVGKAVATALDRAWEE